MTERLQPASTWRSLGPPLQPLVAAGSQHSPSLPLLHHAGSTTGRPSAHGSARKFELPETAAPLTFGNSFQREKRPSLKRDDRRHSPALQHAGAAQKGSVDDLARMCQEAGQKLAAGHTEAAYDEYCDVLALDPCNVKALSTLAVLNHKRGVFELARMLYHRCLRADPRRYKTAYNLGRLEHECKNYVAARELYRITLQMRPDDDTACSALAWEGLLEQEEFGNLEGARRCYEESLRRDQQHIRTLDHKCALLLREGNADAAKQLHQTVRSLDPSHDAAWCPYTSALFNGELIHTHLARQPSRLHRSQPSSGSAAPSEANLPPTQLPHASAKSLRRQSSFSKLKETVFGSAQRKKVVGQW